MGQIIKYNSVKSGDSSRSSSVTIVAGSNAPEEKPTTGINAKLWGNDFTGNDIDGTMHVVGDIWLDVSRAEDEDDEEDDGVVENNPKFSDDDDDEDDEEEEITGTLHGNVDGAEVYGVRGFINYPDKDGEKSDIAELFKDCYSKIEAEKTRAEGKEKELSDAIKAEKTRAEAKEKELSDAIATEKSRAEGAEKTLSDAIKAEKERAEGIEDILDQNIQICEQSIKNNADEIVLLKNRTTAAETAIANYLPVGSIIMFNGLAADIPEGWHICDGTDGTPNLIDRFIKANNTAGGTGGSNSITLQSWNIPKMQLNKNMSKIESDKEWKERLNKKIPTLDRVGERVVDKGGSTHWCLDTGTNEGDHGLLGVNYTTVIDDVADYTYIGNDTPTAISTEPSYYALIFIIKVA